MLIIPHGSPRSGNAYALLALHRATGGGEAAVWLHRARQFAGHVSGAEGRSVFDTPDRWGRGRVHPSHWAEGGFPSPCQT